MPKLNFDNIFLISQKILYFTYRKKIETSASVVPLVDHLTLYHFLNNMKFLKNVQNYRFCLDSFLVVQNFKIALRMVGIILIFLKAGSLEKGCLKLECFYPALIKS